MKLYHHPVSANSRRVVLTAAQLGIPFESHLVDLTNPEDRKALVAINPNNKIPVLVTGDLVLWESHAIMKYLCAQAPDQTLYPGDARGQADIDRWMYWTVANLVPAIAQISAERLWKRFRGGGEPDQAVIDRAEQLFHPSAKVLEAHLAGRTWLVGDSPTLADFSLAPTLLYAEQAKLPMDPYPNVRAHRARVYALPAWRETDPR